MGTLAVWSVGESQAVSMSVPRSVLCVRQEQEKGEKMKAPLGWLFLDCGCVVYGSDGIPSWDAPNAKQCTELREITNKRLALVAVSPTDWEAVRANTQKGLAHLGVVAPQTA